MFKVTNKQLEGNRTIVTMMITEPHLKLITEELDGDLLNESDERLIELVLEKFYRQFLIGKFINEAVDLATTKAQEISETADRIEQIAEAYEQELESMKERSDVAQGAMLELTEMVFDHDVRITALEEGSGNDNVHMVI